MSGSETRQLPANVQPWLSSKAFARYCWLQQLLLANANWSRPTEGRRLRTGRAAFSPCWAVQPSITALLHFPGRLWSFTSPCWSSGSHGLSEEVGAATQSASLYSRLLRRFIQQKSSKLCYEGGKSGYHPFLIVLHCWRKTGLSHCRLTHRQAGQSDTIWFKNHRTLYNNFGYFFLSISESLISFISHFPGVFFCSAVLRARKSFLVNWHFAFLVHPDVKSLKTPETAGPLWQQPACQHVPWGQGLAILNKKQFCI